MNKKVALPLFSIVNSRELLEALEGYMNDRVESLKNELLVAQDFNSVKWLQGSISEITRIKNLREHVLNAKD